MELRAISHSYLYYQLPILFALSNSPNISGIEKGSHLQLVLPEKLWGNEPSSGAQIDKEIAYKEGANRTQRRNELYV